MWRSNVGLQILHFAYGSVQDDRKPAGFRMTGGGCVYGDRNVFLSAAKNLEKKVRPTDREQGAFA